MSKSNKLSNSIILTAILLLALSIQGCGTGKTVIIKPITSSVSRSTALDINEGISSISVPPDVTSDFQAKLADLLFKDGGFVKKPSSTILKYKFVNYDPGNQFMRWLCGGGAFQCGKGKLEVETDFIDSSGNLLTTIQGLGTIESGFFGGTFSTAIDYSAEEISKYAISNFK